MAKVYKVEMYVIDSNNEFDDEKELADSIKEANTLSWVSVKVSDVIKSNEFEWNDDLPINKVNPYVEELEKYFKNK